MVGNRCRYRDQAEDVLQAKAEARTDGVSASNPVSVFGLSELCQDACSKQGEETACKKLHLPIILHFWLTRYKTETPSR